MAKVLLSILLLTLTGCASIVSGGPQVVSINSNPPDAKMTICNDRTGVCIVTGTTPYSAVLDRSQGFFRPAKYRIRCEKEGHGIAERSLNADLNGWYLGNIVFGGLIGMLIVDPATGAMWSLQDRNLVLDLSPMGAPQPVGGGAPPLLRREDEGTKTL